MSKKLCFEMYLCGISVRRIAGVTEALSRVKVGKDAVRRIACRLQEEQREWRERSLEEKNYLYLYLDTTYPKVRWRSSVSSLALLASFPAMYQQKCTPELPLRYFLDSFGR